MKHWKQTEAYLQLAAMHLPLDKRTQVSEYLEHNELGLALEALTGLGTQMDIDSAEFWRPLAKAAGLMLASLD